MLNYVDISVFLPHKAELRFLRFIFCVSLSLFCRFMQYIGCFPVKYVILIFVFYYTFI